MSAEPPRPALPAAADAVAKAAPKDDVLLVGGKVEGGGGYRVLRKRGDALEVGELRDMKEGQPIHGEVVRLSPREGQPRLFDVDVVMAAPRSGHALAAGSGPAQVATDSYRAQWDAIFGHREAAN